RLHARRAGVDGRVLAARLQSPGGQRRALPGPCPACEDGAGPKDGRARQRVARPAARAPPAPPPPPSAPCAAGAARRGARPQAAARRPGREATRVQKVLETANITLASVVTDVLGVSARTRLKALLAGTGTPEEGAECGFRAKPNGPSD